MKRKPKRRPDGVKVQITFPKPLHAEIVKTLAPYGGNMSDFLRLAALHELERGKPHAGHKD